MLVGCSSRTALADRPPARKQGPSLWESFFSQVPRKNLPMQWHLSHCCFANGLSHLGEIPAKCPLRHKKYAQLASHIIGFSLSVIGYNTP
jgi:hypothetical protein